MNFAKALVPQSQSNQGVPQRSFSNHIYKTQAVTDALCGSKGGRSSGPLTHDSQNCSTFIFFVLFSSAAKSKNTCNLKTTTKDILFLALAGYYLWGKKNELDKICSGSFFKSSKC